jgi:hypothetical protein
MNYIWNMTKWVTMQLPTLLRKPKRTAFIVSILAPIKRTDIEGGDTDKSLYAQFMAFREFVSLRVNYNSQQGSLVVLLNKLFDPALKRIRLNTINDTKEISYAFGDEVLPGFELIYANSTPPHYAVDGTAIYDGEILVPIELQGKEAEIRAWVSYHIFLDKNYKITYT